MNSSPSSKNSDDRPQKAIPGQPDAAATPPDRDDGRTLSLPEPLASGADDTRTRATGSVDTAPASDAGKFPQIEGYKLLELIGRGGQSVVYQALQLSTQRRVAIKRLLGGADAEASEQARFEREIRLIASWKHPNIVTVHDSGVDSGDCRFCVMDLIDGPPLSRYVRERKLTLRAFLKLFIPVCDAVQYAHQSGVIHRDLKPGNILIEGDGTPRVLDFGLAKQLNSDHTQLSSPGAVMGTLAYMSPEQLDGDSKRVDARSDVYALGVILYQCLTGDLPYAVHGLPTDAVFRHIREAPPRPLRPSWSAERGIAIDRSAPAANQCPIDAELETIVLKCLAKEPERRYATAAALSEDIRRYLAGEPIEARRDSVAYRVTGFARTRVRRHTLFALTLIAGLSVYLSHSLGLLIFDQTLQVSDWIQRHTTTALAKLEPPLVLEHVRILSIESENDRERIWQFAGDAAEMQVPLTLWQRCGPVIDILAAARATAVVIPSEFTIATQFDAEFGLAAERARESGTFVCIGRPDWKDAPTVPSKFEARMLESVQWLPSTGLYPDDSSWYAFLALERADSDAFHSLELFAASATLRPNWRPSIRFDASGSYGRLRFWAPSSASPDGRRWNNATATVPLSGVLSFEADAAAFDISPNDRVALVQINVPPNKAIADATWSLCELLDATPEGVAAWCGQRAVVIGDPCNPDTLYQHPDGRTLPYFHATASTLEGIVQSVLAGGSTFTISLWPILVCMSCAGIAAGWYGQTRARRLLALLLAALAASTLFVGLIVFARMLCSPIEPMLAYSSSALGSGWVRRVMNRVLG